MAITGQMERSPLGEGKGVSNYYDYRPPDYDLGWMDPDDDEYSLDEIEREEREEEESTCFDPALCICPHPYHYRSECMTAEDAENYLKEMTEQMTDPIARFNAELLRLFPVHEGPLLHPLHKVTRLTFTAYEVWMEGLERLIDYVKLRAPEGASVLVDKGQALLPIPEIRLEGFKVIFVTEESSDERTEV